MEPSSSRTPTPARDYLHIINVQFYMDDAVALMARLRPKSPDAFLHAYFQSVLALEHTIGRDFEFVNVSARNRGAFLRSCHAAFGHIADNTEVVIDDLHQLILLICPSFPEGRVLEIPRLMRESASSHILFGELSTAFYVHFSFYEYLLELKKVFVQPGQGDTPPEWRSVTLAEALEHVSTGTSSISRSRAASTGPKPNDRSGCLPATAVSRAFRANDTLTFDEFVYRLLGDKELASALVRNAESSSAEWLPRRSASSNAYSGGQDKVARLFLPRNSRGEAGADENVSSTKMPKSKPKDKAKAPTKKK